MVAFSFALILQAAINARTGMGAPLGGAHLVGVLAGLLFGALPFLWLLARHFAVERDRQSAAMAGMAAEAARRMVDFEELQQANLLVTVGKLSAMAHELGTPLGVVHARAQLICERTVEDPAARADLAVILEQTGRMTRMVRDALTLARRKTAFKIPVDLAALAEETIGMLRPRASARNVELELVVSPEPAIAHGDASKLLQILTNLTMNAQESMPEGGVVTITVGARSAISPAGFAESGKAVDHLFVDVCDEGTGIAEEHRPRIFDTFFTTKGEGSGLGLSIAYRIASEHGGWIEVTSRRDVGTCFTLYLPIPEVAA
jgi:two-component system NtrC family sensor kinase